MSTNNKPAEASVWRTGYYFALSLLVLFGSSLIVMGAGLFPQGTLPNVALIGIGMSMAPAAVVAALFRVFLFKEVQYQLTHIKGPESRKKSPSNTIFIVFFRL